MPLAFRTVIWYNFPAIFLHHWPPGWWFRSLVMMTPEGVPNSVWRYAARDTLAAVRRFYPKPENRAAFEAWKKERDKEERENGRKDAV